MAKKKKKLALVISGGGAWGAWGGGTIQGLYECEKKDYDIVIGTSTGSLLSPLVSLKEMDRLREAYTSVTQKDIFNVNPFNKKGGINPFNAIWRVLIANPISRLFKGKNKSSLGDAQNLRGTIKKFFFSEDFDRIKKENKDVMAAVVNLQTRLAEHHSSHDVEYEDLVDWIWASACVPIFMNVVEKNGSEYVDGGIVEHIPIQEAINKGATEIDVVVHRPAEYSLDVDFKASNLLKLIVRIIDIMMREISTNDVAISKLRALDKDITINFYYTPHKLSNNSLMFDKETMEGWWDLGYEGIKDKKCVVDSFKITKNNNIKKL